MHILSWHVMLIIQLFTRSNVSETVDPLQQELLQPRKREELFLFVVPVLQK
jgi:hypothetical protein